MRGPEHSLIGLGAGLLVAHALGLELLPSALVAVVGAGVPDMDLKWAPRGYVPRPGSPCRLLEHRGPTHSAIIAGLVGLAISYVVWPWLGIAFAAGWLSHLIADAPSPMGEPLLWPITARRIRLLPYGLRLKSGTRLIELPLALAVLALGLYATGLLDTALSAL